jgi:enediyne biosynthesis protein E4
VSLLSGTAVDGNGKAQGSMGVDAADFDHDGRLDLFVTNFTFQFNTLYWNQGEQGFTDVSMTSKLGPPSYPYVKWGTAFFDVDNDGWPDLLVSSGHVFPQVDSIKGAAPYREPIQLFRNNHDKTFEDVSKLSGLAQLPLACRHGAAFGDVNNDGRIDVLILNVGEPPTLLLNRTESSNHAVLVHLLGMRSNHAAIGARVTIAAGDLKQFNEVRGGSSYMSQNDLRLHFGLGNHTVIDQLEVSWPSGQRQTFTKLPADFIYTIEEGKGIEQKMPLESRTAP